MTSILLVEDDPAISMIVKEMLIDMGMTDVTIVGRLPAALTASTDGRFDCAILDLKLHGQETYAVAHTLAERRIPFAFFTGYGIESLKEYASRPILAKPFAESDLESVLNELLGEAARG
jgi:CheY-like chemotaxis protein